MPSVELLSNDTITEIAPCEMAIVHQYGILKTVVGSGVSVCLYNVDKRIAGMNHFLFPRTEDPEKATGRFGNAALVGLFSLLDGENASEPLSAYVAGAAYCDQFEIESSVENIRVAWKFLRVKEIPIISQSLGGSRLREVSFDVAAGKFDVKNI